MGIFNKDKLPFDFDGPLGPVCDPQGPAGPTGHINSIKILKSALSRLAYIISSHKQAPDNDESEQGE